MKAKLLKIKACFITFIISRFAPDYEKTKSENRELKKDIYNLIRKENKIEGMNVKIRWKMVFDTEDIIMFGDTTKINGSFRSLLSQKSID